LKSVSYTRILKLFNDACASLGLSPKEYGLHSLRRGGATAAAAAGVSDRLLQKHGRWKTAGIKNRYVDETMMHKLSVSGLMGL
jgi:hypothetical protein